MVGIAMEFLLNPFLWKVLIVLFTLKCVRDVLVSVFGKAPPPPVINNLLGPREVCNDADDADDDDDDDDDEDDEEEPEYLSDILRAILGSSSLDGEQKERLAHQAIISHGNGVKNVKSNVHTEDIV